MQLDSQNGTNDPKFGSAAHVLYSPRIVKLVRLCDIGTDESNTG